MAQIPEGATEMETRTINAEADIEAITFGGDAPVPVFEAVRFFMDAAKHTQPNDDTILPLYLDFVDEEYEEVKEAAEKGEAAELLKELCDLIWVAAGAVIAMGVDPQQVWSLLAVSNLTKINPKTGECDRRADGKILKPEGWQKPDFSVFIQSEDL